MLTLAEAEAELRLRTHGEAAYVFSLEGTLLLVREGGAQVVDLSDVAATVIPGSIVVHNHPGGRSFSREDVEFLLRFQAAEARVITARYRYTMSLPLDVSLEDLAEWFPIFSQAAVIDLRLRSRVGEISPEEAELLHLHSVWEMLADVKGWLYQREEWP